MSVAIFSHVTEVFLSIYCVKRTVMKFIEVIQKRQRKHFVTSTQWVSNGYRGAAAVGYGET
jgi:hypothetical protein